MIRMDVTRKNFKEAVSMISDVLSDSSFVSIDGEFTGLHYDTRGIPNAFDTPEERYQKLRQGSMDFMLVQFGLCIFKYSGNKSRYTVYPFNFYVFPTPVNRSAPDPRFLCQSSCIDFLATHNFDFNKLFREGIPYMTSNDASAMREKVMQKYAGHGLSTAALLPSPAFRTPPAKGPVIIPEEHKQFINKIRSKIEAFLKNNDESSLQLDPCNGFQRKLIYQTIETKFQPGLLVETKTGEKKERYMIITKTTEDDRKKKEQIKMQSELEEVEDAVGFSKVIDMISESGRVIVGHNMILDLLHTLNQFSCKLPERLLEFKDMSHCVFHRVVDTKVMASTHPFKEYISSTALADLHYRLQENPFKPPLIEMAANFKPYDKLHNHHEAGFDAYITGHCFAIMANYLGTFMDPPKARISPSSQLLEPFMNKIHLMRSNDIPYLNLTGPDLQPSRNHVFHVTFPKEWNSSDLHQLFNPFGSIYVAWISDTEAYVSVNKVSEAGRVMKTIRKGDNYTVIPYLEYNNGLYGSTDETYKCSDVIQEKVEIDIAMETSVENVGTRKRRISSLDEDVEVTNLMKDGVKRQKQMDPNAPPFVSRKGVNPPLPGVKEEEDVTTEECGKEEADTVKDKNVEQEKESTSLMNQAKESVDAEEITLFEEPDTW